jgi:hypothetical protein
MVRLVGFRDPARTRPDDFFVTSHPSATDTEVTAGYARRWSIEVTNRGAKQDLRGEDPQSWKGDGLTRAAAVSLWLHTAIWCWYLITHDTFQTWTVRAWYRRKSTPSFADALLSTLAEAA